MSHSIAAPAAGLNKPLLILLAGRTFPEISREQGDYPDWIAAGLGALLPLQVLDARDMPCLPEPATLAGVVVSGSHAMVSDREDWSEHLAAWLRRCVGSELPLLGICYGHQLLAHALGGRVADHPAGIEIGSREIALTAQAEQDLLFSGLPRHFPAQLVHYQSARELPEGAVVLARSEAEPHQAFRVGRHAWGVQFHPEFSPQAMAGYIRQLRPGLDGAEVLLAGVRPTPEAASLLRRFAALSKARERVGAF